MSEPEVSERLLEQGSEAEWRGAAGSGEGAREGGPAGEAGEGWAAVFAGPRLHRGVVKTDFEVWQKVMQTLTGRLLSREVYERALQSWEELHGPWGEPRAEGPKVESEPERWLM